jgi:hypothetical protein
VLANLFETVTMASPTFRLPGFAVTPGRPTRHGEQTADASQAAIGVVTPPTRQIELTASKITVTAIVSSEANEDQLLPLLGAIERELGDWLAAGVDGTSITAGG